MAEDKFKDTVLIMIGQKPEAGHTQHDHSTESFPLARTAAENRFIALNSCWRILADIGFDLTLFPPVRSSLPREIFP